MSPGEAPSGAALPTAMPTVGATSLLSFEDADELVVLSEPAEPRVAVFRPLAEPLAPRRAPAERPAVPAAWPPAEPAPSASVAVPPASTWGRGALRRFFAGLGKLALVGLLTYGLMFNFSVVRGSSMSPSIHDGDRILVDHLTFLLQGVRRGDIVVLQYPLDPSVDYIKRVIGLPGDFVQIEGGRVLVNGEPLDEPYVASPASGRLAALVEPDHFFVLGDNRPHSSDSREFGQVHRELIRGRVDVRVWPFGRAGRID